MRYLTNRSQSKLIEVSGIQLYVTNTLGLDITVYFCIHRRL